MSEANSTETAAFRNITECIRKLAGVGPYKKVEFGMATVKTVDEADRKCTAEIVYGETALTVEASLSPENNDGIIQIPALESTVRISIMPDNTCYVDMYSDIDKFICFIDNTNKLEFDANGFILNEGLNGGLINIVSLTTNLNTMVTNINTQLTAIAAGIASAGGTYTPVPLIPFVKTSYEDTSVRH